MPGHPLRGWRPDGRTPGCGLPRPASTRRAQACVLPRALHGTRPGARLPHFAVRGSKRMGIAGVSDGFSPLSFPPSLPHLPLSLPLPLSLSLLFLSLSPFSIPLPLSLSLPPSLFLFLALSLSSLSLCISASLSLSLSLSHTHTHSISLSHTHTLCLSLLSDAVNEEDPERDRATQV